MFRGFVQSSVHKQGHFSLDVFIFIAQVLPGRKKMIKGTSSCTHQPTFPRSGRSGPLVARQSRKQTSIIKNPSSSCCSTSSYFQLNSACSHRMDVHHREAEYVKLLDLGFCSKLFISSLLKQMFVFVSVWSKRSAEAHQVKRRATSTFHFTMQERTRQQKSNVVA